MRHVYQSGVRTCDVYLGQLDYARLVSVGTHLRPVGLVLRSTWDEGVVCRVSLVFKACENTVLLCDFSIESYNHAQAEVASPAGMTDAARFFQMALLVRAMLF